MLQLLSRESTFYAERNWLMTFHQNGKVKKQNVFDLLKAGGVVEPKRNVCYAMETKIVQTLEMLLVSSKREW